MPRDIERRIGTIAARQHGVVSYAQLEAAGLSRAAVGRRLAAGRLSSLHRGVYLLGPVRPPRAAEMAAVLAGGPAATISHTSAGALLGMRPHGTDGVIHVSVPGSGRGRRPGIFVHRVKMLAPDERTVVEGIPVTTPARTLVDLAGMLGRREIEQAAAVAEREGLLRSEDLAALPEIYRGRRGMSALREIVAEETGPAFTRSEAEHRCLELLRSAGLPRPHMNVSIGPYELDMFWPHERVAVEIDGRAHRASRRRFEGDRRRDAWLRAHGIDVVRLSWRQITSDGLPTAVQIGQILALSRCRIETTPEDSASPRPQVAGIVTPRPPGAGTATPRPFDSTAPSRGAHAV